MGRGKKGTEEEADFFHHFPSLLDVGGIFLSFFLLFLSVENANTGGGERSEG